MTEDSQVRPSADHDILIDRLEKIEEQVSLLKAHLQATASGPAPSRTRATSSEGNNPSRPSTQPANKSPGGYYVEDATGATIYLGSRSDAPLVLGCRQPATGDSMLQSAMIDQFVPRAYPFTNLWGVDTTVQDVCETLPGDPDIIRYV